jgi:hypothetical protein
VIVGRLDRIGTTLRIKENPGEARTNEATQGNPSNNHFDSCPHFDRPHDNAAGNKSSWNRDLSSIETGQHYDYLLGAVPRRAKQHCTAGIEAAVHAGAGLSPPRKIADEAKFSSCSLMAFSPPSGGG